MAKVELPREKWSSRVREVKLGNGGRRPVTLGGASALPFLKEEGFLPNPPRIAIELRDDGGLSFPQVLRSAWGKVVEDLGAWARKAAELNPDLIVLRLLSAHPEHGNTNEAKARAAVEQVLSAVDLPLIVIGPEVPEKDNEVLAAASEVARGQRIGLGNCTLQNYRTIAACCLSDGHVAIAKTPLDINLAKQLNSLLSDMGLPPESIMADPDTGALGYGLEYGYTIVERLRLAALLGDPSAATPVIVHPGAETWRHKETKVAQGVPPTWGEHKTRAVAWEALTAFALVHAGADVVVMCHPGAIELVKTAMKRLSTE